VIALRKPLPRLAIALDAPSIEPLEPLLDDLHGLPILVKVGLALFTAVGPSVVHHMHLAGFEVFLDLKLHDIPHQVGMAVQAAVKLDVAMLTVHAGGGRAMLEAAAEAAGTRTRLVAVSVLTSLTDGDLVELGMPYGVEETVARRLRLCESVGLHGAVLSPHELHLAPGTPDSFLRVVPGIRTEAGTDDQQRVATARQAVLNGASMLVIGRPVTRSAQPRAMAEALLDEIARAAEDRSSAAS
jgi:orotidine-5'-phosphate decarboxylase